MIKIETPVKGYNGIDCGIRFENGVANVEDLTEHVENWFKDQGYIVTSDKTNKPIDENKNNIDNKPTSGDEEKKNDDNKVLTKKELTVIAEGLGIEVKSKMTNAEIEALIEAKNIELENAGKADENAENKENASSENKNSDNASNESGDEEKKGE